MKITRRKIKQIIQEEISDIEEGVYRVSPSAPEERTVITGPDDDSHPQAVDAARLEDAIRYLIAKDREDLAYPLVGIKNMLLRMADGSF